MYIFPILGTKQPEGTGSLLVLKHGKNKSITRALPQLHSLDCYLTKMLQYMIPLSSRFPDKALFLQRAYFCVLAIIYVNFSYKTH